MDFFSIPFLGFLSNCCVLWEWFFKPSKGIKLTHQRNQQLPEKWMFSLEGFSSDKYYKYWYGKGFLPILKEEWPVLNLEYTFDLYNSELNTEHFGIKTKYEQLFHAKGEKIKYLKFQFDYEKTGNALGDIPSFVSRV